MATAGMIGSIDLYISERDDLTKQDSDILMQITRASGETSEIMSEESQKEQALQQQYGPTDSPAYEAALEDLKDKYDFKLQEINTWEKELEVQKQNCETQLKEVTSYIESFQSALKTNIKKDYTYGDTSSS